MLKKLKEGKFLYKFKIYGISVLKGSLVYIIGLSLLAIIMDKLKTDSDFIYYIAYIFVMLGGFVCAVSAYKKIKGRGFLTGIISSVPYSVVIFVITAILLKFNLNINILFVFLLSAMGGFLGGITAANTNI